MMLVCHIQAIIHSSVIAAFIFYFLVGPVNISVNLTFMSIPVMFYLFPQKHVAFSCVLELGFIKRDFKENGF